MRDPERIPLLPAHRSSRPSPLVLAALWVPVFLGALDGTVLATLVVPIGSYFNSSHNASYLATSYLLAIAATGPLYGRLSDILGRKRIYRLHPCA
jgi:MFS family permease